MLIKNFKCIFAWRNLNWFIPISSALIRVGVAVQPRGLFSYCNIFGSKLRLKSFDCAKLMSISNNYDFNEAMFVEVHAKKTFQSSLATHPTLFINWRVKLSAGILPDKKYSIFWSYKQVLPIIWWSSHIFSHGHFVYLCDQWLDLKLGL